MVLNFILFIFYIFSFVFIWISSGIIVNSVEKLAEKMNLSSFTASFFILGFLTSVPEFSVGINSIIDKKPEIFVGNLIGASLFLFIFIIPLVAILGNGIKVSHELKDKDIVFSLFVVSAPIFLIADNLVTRTEAVFLVLVYGLLVYFMKQPKGLIEKLKDKLITKKSHIVYNLTLITISFLVIFLSSKYIVNQTITYSEILNIPTFAMSIVLLSIGTNLPELSIAIRAIALKKKDVALGDYIGSATANTIIFGILTLINFKRINLTIYSFKTMAFMLIGLGLFYLFAKSKNTITRKEGLVLFSVYLVFIMLSIFNIESERFRIKCSDYET